MPMREVSIAHKTTSTIRREHLTTAPDGVSGVFRIPTGTAWDAERAKQFLPEISLDRMPGIIGELTERLGRTAVLSLVEAYGGTTIAVPVVGNVNGEARLRELAQVIGKVAAKKLCHDYGGTGLYVPTCGRLLQKLRNAFLHRDRDAMASEGLTEREIVSVLARRYHTSDRNVWRILKQSPVFERN